MNESTFPARMSDLDPRGAVPTDTWEEWWESIQPHLRAGRPLSLFTPPRKLDPKTRPAYTFHYPPLSGGAR